MNQPESTTTDSSSSPDFDDDLPPGSHAIEIAARAGFGPLSPLAREAWHGDAIPCVSCGQLVRREEIACDHCAQDLSEEMLEKMRAHAGPWFVLEHVRPFPGVSLERIIRQIRRGLITEISIIRGPSTDYQWRFAVETPGLCRYFGRCWHCHQQVSLADTYCGHCLSSLAFEKARPAPAVPAPAAPAYRPPSQRGTRGAGPVQPPPANAATVSEPNGGAGTEAQKREDAKKRTTGDNRQSAALSGEGSPELARLSAAIRQARVSPHVTEWDEPPRVLGIRATWFAATLLLIAVATLLFISRSRIERPLPPPAPATQTQSASPSAPVLLPPTPPPPATTAPPTTADQPPSP